MRILFIIEFTIFCRSLMANKNHNIIIHWVMFICQWFNLFISLKKKKQWVDVTANIGAFRCFLSTLYALSHLTHMAIFGVCMLSCLTLCDPMNCSPPRSSVHGILQARTLEWVAISFSRGSSQPRGWTRISYVAYIGRHILYQLC